MAISRERIKSVGRRSISRAFCLERNDVIYEYALKFIVRNDFPFIDELNAFISAAKSSGLIGKWLTDTQMKNHFYTDFSRPMISRFNFEEMSGIWVLLFFLFSFDIFVFISEKIIRNQVQHHDQLSTFWNFAELLIDSDRHYLLDDLRY